MTVHLGNTNFELELIQPSEIDFIQGLEKYPICLQLQFLPLLYARPEDLVAVTELPSEKYMESLPFELPQLIRIDNIPMGSTIDPWGLSPSLVKWTKERQIRISAVDSATVQQVNSKAYSFNLCEALPGARLLHNPEERDHWLSATSGQRVLKHCFGVAGRGQLQIPAKQSVIEKFCNGCWPIVAEPWVDRKIDFSTQWQIHANGSIDFIGLAIIENSPKGVYQRSIVGVSTESLGPFWIAHRNSAEKALQAMYSEGYSGPVGIDAMIYRWMGDLRLHPIVEINARKTMTLAAMLLRKRWQSDTPLSIDFLPKKEGNLQWLPSSLGKHLFRRQLVIQINPSHNLL